MKFNKTPDQCKFLLYLLAIIAIFSFLANILMYLYLLYAADMRGRK